MFVLKKFLSKEVYENLETAYKIYVENLSLIKSGQFSQKVNDKDVIIVFSSDSVKIKDCQSLSKEEQIEVVSFIINYLESNDIYYDRTLNNFVAELSLHSYLYRLGIAETSTKDADLEFIEDGRWYVRIGTLLFQIFGI